MDVKFAQNDRESGKLRKSGSIRVSFAIPSLQKSQFPSTRGAKAIKTSRVNMRHSIFVADVLVFFVIIWI